MPPHIVITSGYSPSSISSNKAPAFYARTNCTDPQQA